MKRRPERGNASLRLRVTLDVRQEEAQLSPTIGLLRLSGERRGGEETAGKSGNERASGNHWITSSARASSDGGIVRPRALAVLRLITSSKVVGCSMGRAAGFAPFRSLSTYVAARR